MFNAQQAVGFEPEATQPGSSSTSKSHGTPNLHEAGPVAPIGPTSPDCGDSPEQELFWPNFDIEGGVANMGSIDFGCDSNFGLGSLDGILHQQY